MSMRPDAGTASGMLIAIQPDRRRTPQKPGNFEPGERQTPVTGIVAPSFRDALPRFFRVLGLGG